MCFRVFKILFTFFASSRSLRIYCAYKARFKPVFLRQFLTMRATADYLINEMHKEGIEPDEFDEDLLLAPDVRDMTELQVYACTVYNTPIC